MAMRAEPASTVQTIAFCNNGLNGAGNSTGNALADCATIAENITIRVETIILTANRFTPKPPC
jgi:hypothetical protein